MRQKNQLFSNFSRHIRTESSCYRAQDEWQLQDFFSQKTEKGFLARGNGLSYSDCCVLNKGIVLDTSRLNHLLSFDPISGIAVCQSAVTFADLFLLDSSFIPPIMPGTLYATLAGGVAHDVHGKNNHIAGNLGHHIEWLELKIGHRTLHCSVNENRELFFATLAGLGLTGVMTRIAIRLKKATRTVTKKTTPYQGFSSLLTDMHQQGIKHDYQVAWLDLLNEPRALLTVADHIEQTSSPNISPIKPKYSIPKMPFRVINRYLMKKFNYLYSHHVNTEAQILPLWQFNNPLDILKNWNYLYGKQGLLQFQAVFEADEALVTLQKLHDIIKRHEAIPTLAVLKYFSKPGMGLLSFVKPGFTIAIDFIHNNGAREAIAAMNQLMTESRNRVYLAKDLLLNSEQFKVMYKNHFEFTHILKEYQSPMSSDLSKRLGITL